MSTVEPVMLEQVRVCHFKRKTCGLCGLPKSNRAHSPKKTATCAFQRRNGCAVCDLPMKDRGHFGAPESFNVLASGRGSGNAMIYANLKATWQAIFTDLLDASGLPKGLARVYVEGEITFPDHSDNRDQGNFRIIVEKALGDALQAGGWIERDSWDHYEFGQLTKRERPGESATRLTLFPVPPPHATPVYHHAGDQLEIT